ncbi:hypothetical protein [Micromonospora yangpuensis]|uniref:hypothetical protein n=1 Tax=Micromonospora yangpuensis TaxID=683228 RepID=UPI001E47E4B4|nr:hypothetical protein [Micromonospora yangpuensis]
MITIAMIDNLAKRLTAKTNPGGTTDPDEGAAGPTFQHFRLRTLQPAQRLS